MDIIGRSCLSVISWSLRVIIKELFIFFIRDDDSDDEIDDQDIHKIMIVTQTPPPIKKHDRTGNYVTRVKMTQELSKAINDGLYYYEQVWHIFTVHSGELN